MPLMPNFFIVGAQKAGTSSLASYVGQHPDVFVPREKELEFFDHEDHYRRGVDWYARFFQSQSGQRRIGEASTLYMYFPHVPARIHQLVPDARIVFVLRNPTERAWSHYWHEVRNGREVLTFGAALAAEERRLTRGFYHQRNHAYKDRGRYLRQIRNYERHFAPEQLHVVLTEDLDRDPTGVVQRMFRFLGIDPSFQPTVERRLNVGWIPRIRVLHYLIERWRLHRFPGGWRLRQWNVAHQRRPMRVTDRELLDAYFAGDNAALAQYLGRDLSHWRHAGHVASPDRAKATTLGRERGSPR